MPIWCLKMVKGFYEDLAKAKKAEAIVLNIMQNATTEYEFTDVSDDKEYWHIGDIQIYDDMMGCNYYLDVKDDGCVSYTGNILAEHRVWYKDSGWEQGFMQNAQYDYVGYLSQPDNKLYILDFNKWKQNYKKYFKKHIQIPHGGNQTTDAYLMSLKDAKKLGIVIAEIEYEERTGWYFPVKIDGKSV